MTDSITIPLGEMVRKGGGKIHTGPFGSQLHASDYVSHGVPCIMPANMKDNRVDLSEIAFITNDDAARLSKYLVKAGDIVYSRRGDVTLKALIRNEEEGYFCGTGCLLLRPGSALDSAYLTYYLSTNSIKNWIVQQAVGATMPNLNTGILASVPFIGPDKVEQRKISNVISALDKKIELNNKINAELEAMAKLIYDYWFVQFDFPDANGKPYKSSGGKMVYNETLKREVPEGWGAKQLSEITSQSTDNIDPSHDANKLYRLFSIPVFDVVKSYGLELGSDIGSNKFVVEKSDLLVSKLNPWFNRVIYAMDEPDQICSTEFVVWRVGSREIKNYLYKIATSEHFIAYCVQSATGTSNSHKRVNPTVMMQYRIAYNHALAKSYGSLIEPVLNKLHLNQKENKQLNQLRDWLLPMLMNGQVTVKDSQ